MSSTRNDSSVMRLVFECADTLAKEAGETYLLPQYLLYALLIVPESAARALIEQIAIRNCKPCMSTNRLLVDTRRKFLNQHSRVHRMYIPSPTSEAEKSDFLTFAPRMKKIIQQAHEYARSAGSVEVTTAHYLVAIRHESACEAAQILERHGFKLTDGEVVLSRHPVQAGDSDVSIDSLRALQFPEPS